MAREATARLYDVDENKVALLRPKQLDRYTHGTIKFQAKKGKLIDLQKMHESIWATRLSGGTRSGVICLDVTAMGVVVESEDGIILTVNGTDRQFVLVNDVKAKPVDAKKSMLAELREVLSDGQTTVSVSGYVDGWVGRWPDVLRQPPARRPQLMVTGFTNVGK